MYIFLKGRNLAIRTNTRQIQILDAVIQPFKKDYCKRMIAELKNYINNLKFLVNMDETAVYMNCHPNRTEYLKGKRTVAICVGGTFASRWTMAVPIAMDDTILLLFVIFKAQIGGSVERNPDSMLPHGVYGYIQAKAWTDERSMHIWSEKEFRPHMSRRHGLSGLMMVDFIVSKDERMQMKIVGDMNLSIEEWTNVKV